MTAATDGCWSKSTPSSCPTAGRWSAPTCPTGWSAPAPTAIPPRSLPWSRPKAGHTNRSARPLERPPLPHRLVCTSSHGDTAEIVAVVKTQGSDTKLVGQLQPYYEAKGLFRLELGGRLVPPLVTQIADGENGGVMMNEFPPKYVEVIRECSGSRTPMLNVTEYLEQLFATGIQPGDLPVIQPLFQQRIWQQMAPGDGPDRLADVIERLRQEDSRFHVEGGSWTSELSWVRGYDRVLVPMEQASSLFHERVLARGVPSDDPRYRKALFHLLAAETSCYRYWGEGVWTDHGVELSRRVAELLGS